MSARAGVRACGSELLAVELKSQKGTVAVAQTRWLFAWREAGAECHVWQPSDLPAIKKRLALSEQPELEPGG